MNNLAQIAGFGTKDWFKYNQSALLFLINNPIPNIREYFRDKIGLYHHDPEIIISGLTPNAVKYRVDKDIFESTIYSGNRFEWNVKREFERLLMPFHKFDLKFANVFAPALNLGYDTLTAYSTTADGRIISSGSATWSTVHDATTGGAVGTTAASSVTGMASYYSSPNIFITRSYFYFDTSSIGTNSISAAVLSLYGVTNGESSVMAQQGTQAATLTTADYDNFSGSSYGNTTGWSTSGYNDITLNAQGLLDINKTGETKYCAREKDHDYDNATSGTSNYRNGCYFSDNTGTSNDPKLVVTHAAASGSKLKKINGIAIASVKKINGIAKASVKKFNSISNV